MTLSRRNSTEGNGCESGMDISELARELDIHPGMLETALDGADRLLRASRENVRPADKKDLRGVAKTLARTNDRLSSDAVRERLVEAAFEMPDGPDDDISGLTRRLTTAKFRAARNPVQFRF